MEAIDQTPRVTDVEASATAHNMPCILLQLRDGRSSAWVVDRDCGSHHMSGPCCLAVHSTFELSDASTMRKTGAPA